MIRIRREVIETSQSQSQSQPQPGLFSPLTLDRTNSGLAQLRDRETVEGRSKATIAATEGNQRRDKNNDVSFYTVLDIAGRRAWRWWNGDFKGL